MPTQRRAFALKLLDLSFRLLHAVLAELDESGGCGLSDEIRRLRLADGDERYLARVAARARGARLDAASHLINARAQTRGLWLRFNLHYCDSVADCDNYNKRSRASATVSPQCVHLSDFRHTIRYGAALF